MIRRVRAESRPARRDTLLGVFWPELEQDRARNALSKAVYFLRQSLAVRKGIPDLSVLEKTDPDEMPDRAMGTSETQL